MPVAYIWYMDVKLKLGLLFNMPKSPPPVAVMSAEVASACPVVPTAPRKMS